jgi:hypothetical protein
MIIIACALAFSLLLPLSKAQTWWDLSWKYRTCFQIGEVAGYNLTNYIVKTTLDTKSLIDAGKMNKDCSDIRVVMDNTSLPYFWIECYTENTTIFFPVNLAPYEKKVGCIYYGNPQAYDERDITIFSWYDNFENETLFNQRNWTLYLCSRATDQQYDFSWSLKCISTATKFAYAKVLVNKGNEFYFALNGENNVNFYINDTLIYQSIPPNVWTIYTSNFSSPSYFLWNSTKAGAYWLDTVFTREKVDIEPEIKVKPEIVYGKQMLYLKTYCSDSYVVKEETVCTQDSTLICTTNQTLTYCDYGCWEGKCNPPPYWRILLIIGIIIGFLFLSILIWRWMKW